jgi:hypothetical protein
MAPTHPPFLARELFSRFVPAADPAGQKESITMKKILTTVLAGALVAVAAAGAFAATTGAKHKSGDHKVSGTIQAYDATTHSLTVKTAKGETSFNVAPDAKVWTGAKSVTLDDLAEAKGRKATVAYSEDAGQKTAKTVRIVPASTKPKK